jgi:hypothetical protein
MLLRPALEQHTAQVALEAQTNTPSAHCEVAAASSFARDNQ